MIIVKLGFLWFYFMLVFWKFKFVCHSLSLNLRTVHSFNWLGNCFHWDRYILLEMTHLCRIRRSTDVSRRLLSGTHRLASQSDCHSLGWQTRGWSGNIQRPNWGFGLQVWGLCLWSRCWRVMRVKAGDKSSEELYLYLILMISTHKWGG